MTVNSYLQQLSSDLVLSPSENESVSKSKDAIMTRLRLYFDTDINEMNLFGSYDRGTILPRKADENSDIDLMIVFNNSNQYKPQTFLNRLKLFAEKYYNTSIIHQSSPSIVIDLQHIKFELTPAYIEHGLYYIPRNQTDWMITDPDGFSDSLVECNRNNDYIIKPIVRLLKLWNIEKNYRDIASFELEKTIAYEMKFAYIYLTSYTDYVRECFEKIKYKTDSSRVSSAIDHIDKAVDYERQGLSYSAEQEIKKVFPEI